MKTIILTLGFLFMSVVAHAWAGPECIIDGVVRDDRSAFAAGCFIKDKERLLLVRHRFGGKLGFPAGLAKFNEKAQCAAHRETWEETGLQVEVGKLAQEFDNGFLLYHCHLLLNQKLDEPLSVPDSGRDEISQVLWTDPRRVPVYEWRFPGQVPEVLRLFSQGLD